jgi:hypothetical protein
VRTLFLDSSISSRIAHGPVTEVIGTLSYMAPEYAERFDADNDCTSLEEFGCNCSSDWWSPGLLTQDVPGVPQDPFAVRTPFRTPATLSGLTENPPVASGTFG